MFRTLNWLSKLKPRPTRPIAKQRKAERTCLQFESMEDRLVPAATIQGLVFQDFNANGVFDTSRTITNNGLSNFSNVSTVVVAGGGSGYSVGQVLTVSGGTGTAAQLKVESIGAGGAITAVRIANLGNYTTIPGTTNVGVSTGAATFNLTYLKDTVGVAVDIGISNVTVTAYDPSNNAVASTTTAPDGSYTLSPADAGNTSYRIQFTNFPAGYISGPHGVIGSGADISGTSTQFVVGNTNNVDFGLVRLDQYSSDNPILISGINYTGLSAGNNQSAIVSFPYSAGQTPILPTTSGATAGFSNPNPSTATLKVPVKDVGATFGLAWDPTFQATDSNARYLYASSMYKSFSDFGPGRGGTAGGADAIYRVRVATDGTYLNSSTFVNLDMLDPGASGGNQHALVSGALEDVNDQQWDAVGKTGLGGMDISADGTKLYVMALGNRSLYELDSNPTSATYGQILNKFDIGAIASTIPGATGSGADIRPWAVRVYNGEVYIGLVNTAQTTQDKTQLRFYVYKLNASLAAGSFTNVLEVDDMTWERQRANPPLPAGSANWRPWIGTPSDTSGSNGLTVYPQPMLTDLAFSTDGNLTLGFRDRVGDQTGVTGAPPRAKAMARPAGDVLRAFLNGSGAYILENNGKNPLDATESTAGQGQTLPMGPGGGQWYFQNDFPQFHDHVPDGSLVQIPGFPDVLTTAFDPIRNNGSTFEGGVRWANNTTGLMDKAYKLYASGTPNSFGKSNGVGGLTYEREAAPIEIGNRLWHDANGNGIQDPGENPISGVKVELFTAAGAAVIDPSTGNPVFATTDSGGNYYFSNATGTNSASERYGITGLLPNTSYHVRIGLAQAALNNYSITSFNNLAAPQANSQAKAGTGAEAGNAVVTLTTGALGISDHTFDAGFYKPVTIGDFVWRDTNGNGVQDSGEPGIDGVTLTLTGTDAAGNSVTDTTTTSGGGKYLFTERPGTYTVTIDATNFNTGNALDGFVATATGKGTTATDSNSSPSGTSPAALPSGGSDPDIDFGFYKPVTVGDFVWDDLNGNGVQDSGEPGIDGVTLTLSGTDGAGNTVSLNTTTASGGKYQFTAAPGTYTVTIDASNFNTGNALDGFVATATGKGTTATDSNTSPSGTTPAALPSGADDPNIDFGFYKPVTIGDFVWRDTNGNGVQDSGEPGIDGVTLTLSGTDGAGNSVSLNTTTASGGKYQFTAAPGTYTVTIDASNFTGSGALVGYNATATGKGTTATDSNSSPSVTSPPTLASGANDPDIDFGFYKPVTIGDYVWRDTNGNGVQDSGEPGIDGVTLTLSGTDGAGNSVTLSTTTAGGGAYQFTAAPGTYTVTIDASNFNTGNALEGLVPTATGKGTTATDSNTSPSGTTPAALPSGADDPNIDFGFYKPVTIGDYVWQDTNGNGVQDSGEPGIDGVTLTLSGTDGAGNSVTLSTTTAGGGAYQFTAAPGTYTVTIDASNFNTGNALEGLVPTATGKGTTATDSNTNPSGTTPAALPSGANDPDIDFGFVQGVTIGNFIWDDLNGNGVQDSGEPGIDGVTLTLTGTDGAGNPVTLNTTTASGGKYQFTAAPGTYTVTIDASNFNTGNALDGFVATATGKGTTATDSNASPSTTSPPTLAGGGSDPDIDFGFYKPVTVGDFVWDDLNGNGVQDSGEPGIDGVTLTLSGTDGAGNTVSLNTTTASGGKYQFTAAPGTYTVTIDASNFNTGNALDGFVATATGKGTTATDSNSSPSGTSPAALPSGGSDPDIDFGFYKPVTVGDFVWRDTNGNGVQDPGEPGIDGVTLTLSGTDGAGNSVSLNTTTASGGKYQFTAAPGTYTVTIDASNFNTGNALEGLVPTATGKGTTAIDSNFSPSGSTPAALPSGADDPDIDFGFVAGVAIGNFIWHDLNGNGVQDSGEPGIAGVTLTLSGTDGSGGAPIQTTATTDANGLYQFNELPGTYTITVDASNFTGTGALAGYTASPTGKGTSATDSNFNPSGTTPPTLVSGNTDFTIDFGFYKNVTVGDFVWYDANNNGIQDNGETGIDGVTLTITGTDAAGNSVTHTATTSGGGAYEFVEAPGTYTITVDATNFTGTGALVGYGATITGQGTAATDSNGNPSGTTPTTLTSGADDPNIDFGFTHSDLTLVKSDNVSGAARVGQTWTWTLRIDNAGSAASFADGDTILLDNLPTTNLTYGTTVTVATTGGVTGTINATIVGGVVTATASGAVTIPRGATITLSFTVRASAIGTYVNPNGDGIAMVDPNGVIIETNEGNNTSTDTVVVTNSPPPPPPPPVSASISGLVYVDANNDGVHQPGETPIGGVTVALIDPSTGKTIATQLTAPDGTYSFTGLNPGTYQVTETQPSKYADGKDSVGSAGGTLVPPDTITSITLGAGTKGIEYNFGELVQGISGEVFYDKDKDGNLDPGEPGIPGVIVTLLDPSGNVVATTTTDANGFYSFPNIPPGTYTIVETQPTGYGDPPGGTFAPNTRTVTLPAGTAITDQNFGDTLGGLSGLVYQDLNNDGIHQSTEPVIPGTTVTLFNATTGAQIATQMTAADGTYHFTGLPAGNYRVVETQPVAFTDGKDSVGSVGGVLVPTDTIDQIPLPAGVLGTEYNFGELVQGISGEVFYDKDKDGNLDPGEPGIPGVIVTLLDPSGNVVATTTTDANGFYSFPNIPPGTYTIVETQPTGYGDPPGGTFAPNTRTVTLPAGTAITDQNFGDTLGGLSGLVYQDLNNDGIHQSTEPVIPGATVTLFNATTGAQIATQLTAADGTYHFTELPAGNYRVVETQPAGFQDGKDSVGSVGGVLVPTDTIDQIPLPAGVLGTEYNFGELQTNSLSGIVYYDKNQNSIYQPKIDRPLSGILITLRDATGKVVGTTQTDATGFYQFVDLPAGQYTITETQPTGYGSSQIPFNVRTVMMPATGNVTHQDFGDTLGNISGTVYRDFNLNAAFNPGGMHPETGIPGVTVTLTNAAGVVVGTTVTDANGRYHFNDLPRGRYTVTETQPPSPTDLTHGFYDGADNLGTLGGTHPVKNAMSLVLGINPTTQISKNGRAYNFGELPPADPFGFVYYDANRNGVRDPGEQGIANVAVTISGIAFAGTPFARPLVAADVFPGGSLTIFTDANGLWQFNIIPPGLYTIRETQPAGFQDGLEQNADPSAPPPTIGNDVFSNIFLNPFPIRGPFNFGEVLPGTDVSKRGLLGSTM